MKRNEFCLITLCLKYMANTFPSIYEGKPSHQTYSPLRLLRTSKGVVWLPVNDATHRRNNVKVDAEPHRSDAVQLPSRRRCYSKRINEWFRCASVASPTASSSASSSSSPLSASCVSNSSSGSRRSRLQQPATVSLFVRLLFDGRVGKLAVRSRSVSKSSTSRISFRVYEVVETLRVFVFVGISCACFSGIWMA